MESKNTAKHRLSWLFRKSPKIAAPHSNIMHLGTEKKEDTAPEQSASNPLAAGGAGVVVQQSTVERIGGENQDAVQRNDQQQVVQQSREQTTINIRKTVVVPPNALKPVDRDKIEVRPATVLLDGKELKKQLATEQKSKDRNTSANKKEHEGRIQSDFKGSDRPKGEQKTRDQLDLQKSMDCRTSEQRKSGIKLSDQPDNRQISKDDKNALLKSMQTAHRTSHTRESQTKPRMSDQKEMPKASEQTASEADKRLSQLGRKSTAPIDQKRRASAKTTTRVSEKLEKKEMISFSETQELLSMHASRGTVPDEEEQEDEEEEEEDHEYVEEWRDILHRRVDYRLRVELNALEENFTHSVEWWEMLKKERSSPEGLLLQIKRERAYRLVSACREGDSTTVLKLLEVGGDPSSQDPTGMTGLHYTSWSGDFEMSTLLLKRGANVNAKGFEDRAPLHFASIFDKVDCVQLLLKHGANVHQQDRYWWTPLHYASASNSQAVGKILLAAGAEVNSRDIQGFTPLEVSAPGELRRLLTASKQTGGGAATNRPES